MTTQFWMIYGIGQGAPTMRHESYEIALAEAKRLARHNPDVEFVVLQAITSVTKNEFVIRTMRSRCGHGIDDDEIPF